MKMILLVFIQMCLTSLVLSDAKIPIKRQTCDYYHPCPSGFTCKIDVCIPTPRRCCYPGNPFTTICYHCFPPYTCIKGRYCKLVPTPTPTNPPTTPTSPTPPAPSPTPIPCEKWCRPPFRCYGGICVAPPTIPDTPSTTPTPITCEKRCPKPWRCFGDTCVAPPTRPETPSTTPKPTSCDKYNKCPPGYKCEYEVCIPVPTTTTTKEPTTTKKYECCHIGNAFKDCYWCRGPYRCAGGNYCQYVPPPTQLPLTQPPTTRPETPSTTPKPTSCDKYNKCPPGYKCEYEVCIPVPTLTTTVEPTTTKKYECCYIGNAFKDCYWCRGPYRCAEGNYCKYVPPPTQLPPTQPPPTQPPITTQPPTTTPSADCDKYGNCPEN